MAKKPKPRDLGAELGALSQFAADYARAQAEAQAAATIRRLPADIRAIPARSSATVKLEHGTSNVKL